MTALPTRRQEAFRYADLAALEALWPLPVQDIRVAAGETGASAVVLDGANDAAQDIAITLEDGAEYDLRLLNAGSAYGRIAVKVTLGNGAKFHLGAAQIAGGEQTAEIVTEVVHAEPDAVSSQVVRSVLGGKATGTYLGRVVVARGAIGTDGEQSIRAMLLDRTATANARPELEIYADDVKCAHGCAVGELDPQGLFYLAQRGLPPAEAKKLMLHAFIAEAFVGAADEESLTEAALKALDAVL
ncbi:SufD family Fe-S cluster assembly protein [Novosphingobium subterraneum]|uniref:SufBD n=1 Tax=Novosphingobium subterraneum TaxID=48936 RepID=A0A0B8ZX91_9SPHN|nr:SufD family Fe-S cluster assembly protein [Novosphingobium subterraneum]KHS47735.1 SufBD [Novosphingobium subterraneum]